MHLRARKLLKPEGYIGARPIHVALTPCLRCCPRPGSRGERSESIRLLRPQQYARVGFSSIYQTASEQSITYVSRSKAVVRPVRPGATSRAQTISPGCGAGADPSSRRSRRSDGYGEWLSGGTQEAEGLLRNRIKTDRRIGLSSETGSLPAKMFAQTCGPGQFVPLEGKRTLGGAECEIGLSLEPWLSRLTCRCDSSSRLNPERRQSIRSCDCVPLIVLAGWVL